MMGSLYKMKGNVESCSCVRVALKNWSFDVYNTQRALEEV